MFRRGPAQAEPVKTQEEQKAERDEATVRRKFWPKLRDNLHRVPFAQDGVAAYYSMIDPATPARTKAILAGALAYFVMPADMIPDALALLGFTDDATVLMTALKAVRGSLTPAHYERARTALHTPPAEGTAPSGDPAAGGPAADEAPEPQPSP